MKIYHILMKIFLDFHIQVDIVYIYQDFLFEEIQDLKKLLILYHLEKLYFQIIHLQENKNHYHEEIVKLMQFEFQFE